MSLRFTLAPLAGLLLAAPLAAHFSVGDTPLEEAVKAFQAGKFAAVVEAAAKLDPDASEQPKMQYLAGEALLLLERPAEARKAFEVVLSVRPKAVPAQVGLGRALTRSGALDEASELLARVLEHVPGDVGAQVAQGELLLARREIEPARKLLAKAHALAPEDPLATRVLFEAHLRADDGLAAAALAEDQIERRAQHPLGYFLLAVIMERDGADEDAIAQYQAAIEVDDTFLDAHKNLAILCHTLSDTYRNKERTKMAYLHYARYFELGGGDEGLRTTYEQLLSFKDQILGT